MQWCIVSVHWIMLSIENSPRKNTKVICRVARRKKNKVTFGRCIRRTTMTTTRTRKPMTITQVFQWLLELLDSGKAVDDYELLQEMLASDEELAGRVSVNLAAAGVPELNRETYAKLSKEQFDVLLEALLEALDMSLEEARELFCEKLDWCNRREGWRRRWSAFKQRMLAKVPSKFHKWIARLGAAAPWIWDFVSILLALSQKIELSLLAARLSAFLSIKGLDKLCRCGEGTN